MKKIVLFIVILLSASSCFDYVHPTIPTRKVDIFLYLDDARYQNLLNYGGFVYLTGGVNGLVAYRLTEDTFMAYDRACPFDWQEDDAWLWMEESNLTLKCSRCGSQFNILDGSVISGPSQNPLYAYRTQFDGFRLRIYN